MGYFSQEKEFSSLAQLHFWPYQVHFLSNFFHLKSNKKLCLFPVKILSAIHACKEMKGDATNNNNNTEAAREPKGRKWSQTDLLFGINLIHETPNGSRRGGFVPKVHKLPKMCEMCQFHGTFIRW